MAEDRAAIAACRPKRSKLSAHPRLRRRVRSMLCERYSPQQISARLKLDFPAEEEMRISPETIYQSLYFQSRGRFRKDLSRYLRTGRSKRKPQGSGGSGRGKIAEMVMISERPAEVADRAVPGHWEGDLIVGKANRSFIATLVERQSRFVMLAKLDDSKTETVTAAIAEQIQRLPEQLRLSLTWDQGTEMAAHHAFSVATGVDVYFCDPHSPWQRGSNENTNGLLRQYFPKGTDLAVHGQIDLDRVAAQLNGRPRQTLQWRNPAEKMAELLR
jgi:IS30 family transposase